jgi:NAD-dependent dihydropyrimidine dehydrogenase PreA subunit
MAKRVAVVVSQGQSANPAKRRLEEDIVTALLAEPGVDVTVIPHLYDLKSDGTGLLALQGISGDMIVLSWLYERAARWTLDRHAIRGLTGKTLVVPQDDEADDDLSDEVDDRSSTDTGGDSGADGKTRVSTQREVPQRNIYCIDLRVHANAQPYLDEVRRIVAERCVQLVDLGGWIAGRPSSEQTERYLRPQNDTALPLVPGVSSDVGTDGASLTGPQGPNSVPGDVNRIIDEPERRWYPVIDYSRCTNCMECIDFCLFGVYGIDRTETILVEQPDNCRKGCPACSRVCPENAIIFPQHKTPAIAGAPVGMVSLKIDLSKLFGAPDQGKSAAEMAVLERDEQLLMAGRQAVGMTVGVPKRQLGKPAQGAAVKDELDALLDELDGANL